MKNKLLKILLVLGFAITSTVSFAGPSCTAQYGADKALFCGCYTQSAITMCKRMQKLGYFVPVADCESGVGTLLNMNKLFYQTNGNKGNATCAAQNSMFPKAFSGDDLKNCVSDINTFAKNSFCGN